MSDLQRQLKGYSLTTAEILYHRPDHPSLLQSYIWQEYDLAPHFPVLHKFIEFWQRNLDGPIHSVTFATKELIGPPEVRMVGWSCSLH